ncbi:carboxypeptidase-like regulatory domain-containing protein [Fodinibius sp. Rm-B-1B1-1]|uniref:carboxypeptidase-like regulatory domain-containing protein n=1 Tax=Fodinibius alkaliphilus TaxID=3140241 RepID=UPI00315A3B45
MFKKLLSLGVLCVLANLAYAQSTITGTVIDSETEESLPGANILIQELERGAATNASGEYEITNVEFGTYTFRVTFIGYRTVTREVEINNENQTVNFELQSDLQNLEEVVVSGIASETSRSVTQISVAKVNAEELQVSNSYTGISELLQGKAAGVNISAASGNPGGGIRFQVRSGGGLGGDGQPIIYIDGTRVDNSEIEGFGVGGQGIGALSDLNPDDIASVEILKGPAAAALYGTSGSSGVVLIETKSGRGVSGGAVQVDFKSTYGINTKQQEYSEDEIYSAEEANETIESNPYYNNSITVSGGTETIRYLTGLTQRYEEGLGPKNTLDRQSFRGNFEAFPNDNFTVSANTSFTLNEISRPQADNNIFGYLGNLILAPGGTTYNFTAREAIDAIDDNNKTNRFVGSLSATWTPVENLDISGSFGYDGANLRQSQFFSPDFGYAGIINGERAIFMRENKNFTYDLNASYNYNIGEDVSITSIVGTQIFNRRLNTTFVQKDDFPSSAIRNVASGAVLIDADETFLHTREAGVFTQHDFSYDDTYYLSLGGRFDFASSVGDEAPTIFYPQARASVRLEQFDFLPESIDLFKVRAAYGETGQLPGIFDGTTLLFGAAAYGVGRGVIIEEVGNPDIEPERIKELSTGIDVDFLGSYGIGVTYYNQWARQSIIGFEESPSTGLTFDDPPFNVGGVDSWGVEVGLTGTPFRSRNYQFDFNLQWSYQENEVVDLGGAQPIFDGFDVNVIDEGLPKSAFYVLDVDGALRDDDGNIVLGSDGLPAVNLSEDRVFKGQPYPEQNGSLSLTFRFLRNFELYQNWDFATGLDVYNNTRIFMILFGNDVKYDEKVEAFSNASPGSDEYRRLADELANLNPNYDGNFIEDASYLKLRELSFSYNFNTLIQNSPLVNTIRNLRLSVSGRNLLTFTDYSGIDPEVNFTGARSLTRGADFLTLQTPRVFSATLNIGF